MIRASDEGDLAARALVVVGEVLTAASLRRRRPRITLPAGQTPLPLYRQWVADPQMVALLRTADIFQLDEYLGAEPEREVSFWHWLRRTLLDPAAVPAAHRHRLPADDPEPQLALAAFEAELAAGGGLDLAVLGLGLNGHLGFNEPGSRADSPARIVRLRARTLAANRQYWSGTGGGHATDAADAADGRPVDAPDTDGGPHAHAAGGGEARPTLTHGMTLGLRTLLAARTVLLLVSGEHKAAILQRALEEPPTARIPASWLARAPGRVVVAADAAAARLLTQPVA